ncbi:hypothetical protein V6Z12_D08G079100 [Gossypium hirsutum]
MPLTFHHHSMHRCIRRPRFLEVNACNKYNKLYNHFFGRLNI